ncbi:hypothetical protein B0H17DRAFT_1221219 [Mycena rosella]|uniref:Uncharacterized protein n=1 Tax=Mycena rosella TaxID=1033263 RepID=A0AAD7B5I2_MYCRO|nr:hypothetical protein B0H17DRAFT_1221219 [Mycena rosella]
MSTRKRNSSHTTVVAPLAGKKLEKNGLADAKYDPGVVEILHKDFRGEFDIDTVFLNPKLHLCGSSSEGRQTSDCPCGDNDQIWGLQHTTPGDIATSAIAGELDSACPQMTLFAENGTVTGINWAADHELYVKYLTTGLEKRKASVFNISASGTTIFFPGRGAGLGGRADDGGGGSTTDVMAALNADADVEEETGGDENESRRR